MGSVAMVSSGGGVLVRPAVAEMAKGEWPAGVPVGGVMVRFVW